MNPQQKQTSHKPAIKTADDLRAEIQTVKGRVRAMEQELNERLKQLPGETIKATLGSAIPIFMNQAVAAKTWGLIQHAGTFLFSNPAKGKGGIKETVFTSLKQVGLFAGLRALYSLWKKR